MTWPDFFSSQLFGIILGALLTGGFNWLLDLFRNRREHKRHIRFRQEETYLEALGVLQEYCEYAHSIDIRETKSANEKLKIIQLKMGVFASKKISSEYNKIVSAITPFVERKKVSKMIQELQTEIRDELGVKNV